MVTTDPNGIVFYEENDLFAPVHTTLNLLSASVSEAVGGLEEKSRTSTVATTVPLANTEGNFALYYVSQPLRLMRTGNNVYFGGIIKGLKDSLLYTSYATLFSFATIPAGYRPTDLMPEPRSISQASGRNRWCCTVQPATGVVSASRYGPNPDTGSSTWLSFYLSWITLDDWPV